MATVRPGVVPNMLGGVPKSKIAIDIKNKIAVRNSSPSEGRGAFALGTYEVIQVMYEDMMVKLRAVTGENRVYDRVPVPLTFPGVGARHFFGVMPMEGDYCVCGHMMQESGGMGDTVGTTMPVILTWIPHGHQFGYDWLPTQPFTADELDMTPRQKAMLEGNWNQIRFKGRHIQPGTVLASSAQGADFILDESVTLMNRRANEVKLRDSDQALVLRSLQQFHAMAGVKISAGMVQRDATLLQTQMVSDGLWWDAAQQMTGGDPVFGGSQSETPEGLTGLPVSAGLPAGLLTPTRILSRQVDDKGVLLSPLFSIAPELDPFSILKRGLFIDSNGYVVSTPDYTPGYATDTVYGGKPIYRVAAVRDANDPKAINSMGSPASETLTEYRLDIAHTADGTLPVTEQTDGFNADGLAQINKRFIEHVWGGSVVGNDPTTDEGRKFYGVPLTPVIFQGDQVKPGLESGLGRSILEHAATLFKLNPLDGNPSTFWATNKKGQVKAYIGGPKGENSFELAMNGSMRLACGVLDLGFDALNIRTGKAGVGNVGLGLRSDTGAVYLYGGGEINTGAATQTSSGIKGAGDARPSVLIEGKRVAHIKSSQLSRLSSEGTSLIEGASVQVRASGDMELSAGDKIKVSTKEHQLNVTGKSYQNFSGPKDFLPTAGPFRETSFAAGIPGLVVDKSTYQVGDREELFLLGNHTTSMLVGNMTYETGIGTISQSAGLNTSELSYTSGLNTSVIIGNVVIDAKAGASILNGQVSVAVTSKGLATLSGVAGAFLGGPGKIGMILSTADLDPLTGLPFGSPTLGMMGSPGHTIGLPV